MNNTNTQDVKYIEPTLDYNQSEYFAPKPEDFKIGSIYYWIVYRDFKPLSSINKTRIVGYNSIKKTILTKEDIPYEFLNNLNTKDFICDGTQGAQYKVRMKYNND